MSATKFNTFCVSADYVMPNSRKDSRHIMDDFSRNLYSCHKILLCRNEGLVHQGFHVHTTIEIRWCQVRWTRGSDYWTTTPNSSVAKGVIQVETEQGLVARIQLAAGVIRDMPGIFPRVPHDIIRRNTKCIEVGGGHISAFFKGNKWCSLF